jgi:hypothetical protein
LATAKNRAKGSPQFSQERPGRRNPAEKSLMTDRTDGTAFEARHVYEGIL